MNNKDSAAARSRARDLTDPRKLVDRLGHPINFYVQIAARYKHGTFTVNTNTVLACITNTVLEFLLVQV